MKYISAEDHAKISDRSKVDVGDILFAMIGSIGNPVIVYNDKEFSIKNVALFKFYLIGAPDNRYLHYFLTHAQENIKAISSGAVQSFVSLGFLRNYLFPLPPLAEQRRIVAKIDQLMARCDELEKLRAEREQKRFAVHTAALKQLLDEAVKPSFAPSRLRVSNFFSQHFNELYSVKENVAELRKAILQLAVMGNLTLANEIKNIILGDVIELISGQHLLANQHNEVGKGIPYLTGPSDFGAKYPTPSRWTETPKVVSEPGDILITVKGAGVGKTNKLIAERTAISRQLMAVRVTKADPDFIHLVLLNAAGHFQSSMTGIAIPGIGRKDVLNLKVKLPPLAEQHRIVAKIDQLMAHCDELDKQINAATGQQIALLNAVMAQL